MYPERLASWNFFLWVVVYAILIFLLLTVMSRPVHGETRLGATPANEQAVVNESGWEQAIAEFRTAQQRPAVERFASLDPAAELAQLNDPAGETAWAIWTALMAQTDRRAALALDAWHAVVLPPETLAWKHLAMAAVWLEQGRLEEANDALKQAWMLDAFNPLVHYFTGLVRLDEAAAGYEWFDAIGPPRVRCAVQRQGPPNHGIYHLLALTELERASEMAHLVRPDQPLLTMTGRAQRVVPTVRDVLIAARSEGFEGNAHHVLGQLFLDRREWAVAEQHLDQVPRLDGQLVFGYEELGAGYEQSGQHLDAARAYAKAIRHGPQANAAADRVLRNLWHALRHGWIEGVREVAGWAAK